MLAANLDGGDDGLAGRGWAESVEEELVALPATQRPDVQVAGLAQVEEHRRTVQGQHEVVEVLLDGPRGRLPPNP